MPTAAGWCGQVEKREEKGGEPGHILALFLTRAAPALNIFAVGFPITLTVGFAMLAISLQYLSPNFQRFFMHGMENIDLVLRGLAP